MSHFYSAQFPIFTFERVPASESQGLHLVLLVVSCLAFLATLLAWPGGWVVRKWFRVQETSVASIPRLARLALWAGSAVLLAVVVGLVVVMSNPNDVAFGELGSIKVVLALPLIALIPMAFALFATVKIWWGKLGTMTGRICYALTVVLAMVFYWQLAVWNLLGVQTLSP